MGVASPLSPSYCRQIETYLCQKNGGHLVRVVGPSFDLVNGWMAEGIPLKIAYAGIDRYFERYYKKGGRRRPVRIDFCDADVRDVFDEWRRATGLTNASLARAEDVTDDERGPAGSASGESPSSEHRGPSLPQHLTRVLVRLTSARASGAVGPAIDPVLDAVSSALDTARAAGGLRGEARKTVLARLEVEDAQVAAIALASIDAALLDQLRREAEDDLSAYRGQLSDERYRRSLDLAVDRLVRARLALPTLIFS